VVVVKKSIVILALVLVLASACVSSLRENVYLHEMGFGNEYVMPGSYVVLSMDLMEHGLGRVKGTTAAVEVPELGIRERLAGFTLEDRETLTFFLYIPYGTPAGEYAARIMVVSDHDEIIRRVAYRFFYVI
jgi:hypothetical protein